MGSSLVCDSPRTPLSAKVAISSLEDMAIRQLWSDLPVEDDGSLAMLDSMVSCDCLCVADLGANQDLMVFLSRSLF